MSTEGKGQAARARREPDVERHFDAFAMATRGGTIEGHVDASQFTRLDDLVAPSDESIDVEYRITGADDTSRPALDIRVKGEVPLVCQRCLQPFVFPVDQQTQVLLARDERELARIDEEDPEHEVILADAPLDAVSMVEDELVLTLPFVPRCPEATCSGLTEGQAAAADESREHSSPFDALAQLRAKSESKPRR